MFNLHPIRHRIVFFLALLASVPLQAGVPSSDGLRDWGNGPGASGEWLGIRPALEDRGVEFFGSWRGVFYGLTGGGLNAPHGAFDEELTLGITLDFAKWGIEGLTAEGSVRYRDGRSPNTYVGASSTFNPSRYQSGLNWRLMPFFVTYTTPELWGVKKLLTLSGGWQNPYTFFAHQPDSKLFMNNSISGVKGIGGVNKCPWSSSYAAWGGHVAVKPTDWFYAMAGLYLAIPEGSAQANHGLDLAGYGPAPGQNGLYFLAETGVTPQIGPDKLPGKYAFGFISLGLENPSFSGQTQDQTHTFYWQADQMLFRETPEGDEGKPSEQGLYGFTFFTHAPASNNAMPFYFHAGLVYKGLVPGRDKDQLGAAFGLGNYSSEKIAAENEMGNPVHQTYEAVMEADYRVQVTRFAFIQPFWQYIIRPNGTGQVPNANLFGVHVGVTF